MLLVYLLPANLPKLFLGDRHRFDATLDANNKICPLSDHFAIRCQFFFVLFAMGLEKNNTSAYYIASSNRIRCIIFTHNTLTIYQLED